MGAVAKGEVMVAQASTGARNVGHGLLAALGGGGGPVPTGGGTSTPSLAALATSAAVVASPGTAGDGGHDRQVIIHDGGDMASVAKVVGPEGVGARGELGQGRDAVLRQHDAQLAR